MREIKYKVGDRVRIKSLYWYEKNKDEYGYVDCGKCLMNFENSQLCGKIVTISRINDVTGTYKIEEDNGLFFWTDEMIECKVEEGIEDRMKELRKMCTISLTDSNYSDKVEVLLNDYEYTEEGGKSYFVKKKKAYPKTYEGCCEVLSLGEDGRLYTKGYKASLIQNFQKLLICRDAYWKIAGEELGLEGPWEPDHRGTFEHGTPIKYVIYNIGTHIVKERKSSPNHILSFPTEEMAYAFYEAFQKEIEICKKLL